MIEEVVSTVMSTGDMLAQGSIQASSLSSGGVRVSMSALLSSISRAPISGGGTTIPSDLTLDSLRVTQDATIEGTLDAGDTLIIGQTAAQRANPAISHPLSATLQLGPAWRLVGTDSSIEVHFAPNFVNFVKVATLVQLEE
jgi:hypothetical protein